MVAIKTKYANKNNYGGSRNTSSIKYIVIHYTGNDGDTDESNANYFYNNIVKASAHYFVDDDSITQSVPDNYIAYSVGGSKYANTKGGSYYGKCTNANSISVELCDNVKNGTIYPTDKTISRALELVEYLMNKYSIPKENVIRHYDVNGKACPAYWCGTTSKDFKWKSEFWNKINLSATQSDTVTTTTTFQPYLVKINTSSLNVRKGVGTSYPIVTVVKKGQVYTIVEVRNGWGKLKSGIGWIKLSYTQKL